MRPTNSTMKSTQPFRDRSCRRLLGTAIILASATAMASGDVFSWNNLSGGSFEVETNWLPSGPPQSPDQATFSLGSGYTVSFASDHTNDRLLVDSDDVTFDLGGRTYILLHEADETGVSVHIAENNGASLSVLNGSVSAKDASIGRFSSPDGLWGRLTVGSAGRWTAFQHFIATGDGGNGELSVLDGGIVEHGHGWAGGAAGTTGVVNVSGIGSDLWVTGWYGLGIWGHGQLSVQNRGQARMGACEIATESDSQGQATVEGTGSTWTLLSNSEVSLMIGKTGSGEVQVRSGGQLQSAGHVHLGENSGASGILKVEDADSQITIDRTLIIGVAGGSAATVEATSGGSLIVTGRGAGDPNDHVGLEVGREGEGTLNVLAAGHISNDWITTIGAWAGGVGHALVDGGGSVLQANYQLEIGRDGNGTVTIRNGGRISVTLDNPDPELTSKGLTLIGLRGTGNLIVTGSGGKGDPSTLDSAAQIQIGLSGAGGLLVSGGGLVNSYKASSPTGTSGIIGRDDVGEGTAIIQDAGSKWVQDGAISVGWLGRGTLFIDNGGVVQSEHGYIGRSANSVGMAMVGGGSGESRWDMTGSLVIAGTDAVAAAGAGTLAISAGGAVNASLLTRVWEHGRIDYNGGSFTTGMLDLLGGGDVILAAGSDKTLVATAILIDVANGSRLDVADNEAIVDYTGLSPINSIRQLLQSGSAGGWTGNGITSSSAAGDSTKALGYGESAVLGLSSFGGYGVDSTCVLIKFTWKGDANLDGHVDISDLGALATAWQTSSVWTGGDSDYSGFVDISDLGILATNWQRGVGNPLGLSFDEALANLGLPGVTVPEPLGLFILPLALLLGVIRIPKSSDAGR